MKIDHKRKGSTSQIAIEGELVIGELANAKVELLTALEKANTAHFDLSRISECDAAGLQFLLMAIAGLKARNAKFSVTQPSEAVSQVAMRAGLSAEVFGAAERRVRE